MFVSSTPRHERGSCSLFKQQINYQLISVLIPYFIKYITFALKISCCLSPIPFLWELGVLNWLSQLKKQGRQIMPCKGPPTTILTTTGVAIRGTGTAYPSGAPEFTLGF
jgi:hypothetical protein